MDSNLSMIVFVMFILVMYLDKRKHRNSNTYSTKFKVYTLAITLAMVTLAIVCTYIIYDKEEGSSKVRYTITLTRYLLLAGCSVYFINEIIRTLRHKINNNQSNLH